MAPHAVSGMILVCGGHVLVQDLVVALCISCFLSADRQSVPLHPKQCWLDITALGCGLGASPVLLGGIHLCC